MSDIINEIIGQHAIDQLKEGIKLVNKLLVDFEKASGGAKAFNAAIKNANGFEKTTSAAKKQRKQLTELDKVKQRLVVANERLAIKEHAYIAMLEESRIEANKSRKEMRETIQAQKASLGSYKQLDLELKKLTRDYKELSKAEREAGKGKAMIGHIQALEVELQSLDATMGKHNRNVGNYNNQTFQMTQVLRELPAFAYSAQTGFMGISNNLPMLADGFAAVKRSVGSTAAALSVFAKSLFTFPNLFAIAIGAITILMPKITKAAESMNLFGSETKKTANLQKEFAKLTKESAESAAEETAQLNIMRTAIENTNLPMSERVNWILKLKKEFPKYFEGLKQEDILNGKVGDAYKLAAAGILAKARAQAASAKITELQNKILAEELKLEESRSKSAKELANAEKQYRTRRGIGGDVTTQIISKEEVENTIRIQQNAREKESQRYLKSIKEEQEFYIKKVTESSEFEVNKSAETRQKIKSALSGSDRIGSNPTAPSQIIPDNLFADSSEKEVKALESKAKKLKEEYLAAISRAFGDPAAIAQVKDVLNSLIKGETTEEQAKQILLSIKVEKDSTEQAKKDVEKLLKDIAKIKEGAQQFLTNGSDIADIIFQKEMEQLGAKKRAMEEYYTLEEAKVNASFLSQEEKTRVLGRLAIEKAAKDKALADENLRIRQRQARAEKAFNVASIISNTALAIIKFLAKPGGPQGLALSIGAGITGAVQLGKALAAPIPQFAKGVKSKPTDGPAIVGEQGREIIKEPGKDPYFSPSTSTLTYLKKGTEVIPNHKLHQYAYQNPKMPRFNSTSTTITESKEAAKTNRKLDSLIEITKRKSTVVNVRGDAQFYVYQKNNIR